MIVGEAATATNTTTKTTMETAPLVVITSPSRGDPVTAGPITVSANGRRRGAADSAGRDDGRWRASSLHVRTHMALMADIFRRNFVRRGVVLHACPRPVSRATGQSDLPRALIRPLRHWGLRQTASVFACQVRTASGVPSRRLCMKPGLFCVALLLVASMPGCRQTEPTERLQAPRPPAPHSKCQVAEDNRVVCSPSLVELVVRPEWYDGMTVAVAGVLQHGTEGVALFTSEEAYRYRLTASSVSLRLSKGACPSADCGSLSGQWVNLRGRYLPPGWRATVPTAGTIVEVGDIVLRHPGLPKAIPAEPRVVPDLGRIR